jgi:hypothetical protein
VPWSRAVADRDRQPLRRAPAGAGCHRHPERPALARCPLCDRDACLFCWHDPFERCEACLAEAPAAAAPPVPWEDPAVRPLRRRLWATLATVARPTASAPAFARHDVGHAVRFALLTVVPLALLRGVIPYTHTVLFGDRFAIALRGEPDAGLVALDVVRAMGLSALLVAAGALALGLPFVHLAGAYGSALGRRAALRVLLYRGWLLALAGFDPAGRAAGSGLLFSVALWGMPTDTPMPVFQFFYLVDAVVPILLLLFSMRATARFAAGTGAVASFVLTLLPFVLLYAVQGALLELLVPLMPGIPG